MIAQYDVGKESGGGIVGRDRKPKLIFGSLIRLVAFLSIGIQIPGEERGREH